MSGLENAALNGDLFRPHRSPSPARSLESNGSEDNENDSSDHNAEAWTPSNGARTGPKGVLADQKAQREVAKLERDIAKRNLIAHQESTALIGVTSTEEDDLRDQEFQAREKQELGEDELEKWRRGRMEELRGEQVDNDARVGRRGLREVGKDGFLNAVERPGWCVVLIYEPNLPRCDALLASLLSLSLSLPSDTQLTLLRARATSLEFSLLPLNDPEDPEEAPRADLDVLPTLLAYRDGELEKTWIRADWEVGEDGVEGLLKREGILASGRLLGLEHDAYDDEDCL